MEGSVHLLVVQVDFRHTSYNRGLQNFTGTGGTIAGIGRFLKSVDESILVALSDPTGSGLYNKVALIALLMAGCISRGHL